MSPFSQVWLHLQGIPAGERPRDRMAILVLIALRALGPLWRLFNLAHLNLPSPLNVVPRYRITDGTHHWEVRGTEGAAYLFPRTELGSALDGVNIDGGVCIDVGASFGWYTVRWATRLESVGHVLALEPDLRHFPSLIRNVALNQLGNVTALPVAVGDQDGSLSLFSPRFGQTIFDASAIPQQGMTMAVQVPMRTIDGLIEELRILDVRLVKIDVEGFEPQVLHGMSRLLQRDRPHVVFEAWTAEALTACCAELPSGYAIQRLNDWDYLAQPH